MTDTEKAALERRIDELCEQVGQLTNENVFLRYVAENLAMIANDLVCDDFDRDEMLEKANEDLRSLGIEV